MWSRFGDRCYFCADPCVEDQRVTAPLLPALDAATALSGSSSSSPKGAVVEVRRVYHPECLHCVATGEPLGGGGGDDDAPEVFLGDDDGLPYTADA